MRYAETDAMGVVHHRNYLVWFELGRVEYMRQAGKEYADVERGGVYLAVSEAHARYLAPARFGDQVTVRTTLGELRSRGLRFDYTVVAAATGQLLVEGYTRHVPIDRASRVTHMPEDLRACLRAAREA